MGWAKPVQINPGYYKNPKLGTVLVSLAGPIMNFIIAFISMFGIGVILKIDPTFLFAETGAGSITYKVLINLVGLNIGLGIFNLIPIPPLDGSKVLSAVLPEKYYFGYMKYEHYFMIVLLIAVYMGFLSAPINALNDLVFEGMFEVVRIIFRF
ncbi:membrane metalloprotease [Lachnospiraceae bacterium TWA4]|nr:membrane metalloprotease [Lachnospiraceae bacterium TWA4]